VDASKGLIRWGETGGSHKNDTLNSSVSVLLTDQVRKIPERSQNGAVGIRGILRGGCFFNTAFKERSCSRERKRGRKQSSGKVVGEGAGGDRRVGGETDSASNCGCRKTNPVASHTEGPEAGYLKTVL